MQMINLEYKKRIKYIVQSSGKTFCCSTVMAKTNVCIELWQGTMSSGRMQFNVEDVYKYSGFFFS